MFRINDTRPTKMKITRTREHVKYWGEWYSSTHIHACTRAHTHTPPKCQSRHVTDDLLGSLEKKERDLKIYIFQNVFWSQEKESKEELYLSTESIKKGNHPFELILKSQYLTLQGSFRLHLDLFEIWLLFNTK